MTLVTQKDQHYLRRRCFLNLRPLALLESLLDRIIGTPEFSLKNIGIVYIHHPLNTSIHLIDAMIRLGALPQNIFVLGKKYSECYGVVERIKKYGVYYQLASEQIALGQFSYAFTRDINWLWKHVHDLLPKVDNILILDHGGYACSFIPVPILKQYNVVGVEKTTSGLIKLSKQGLPPFPIISMATCVTKKELESPLIAEAIVQKLVSLLPNKTDGPCGIIGYGTVGKALAAKLVSMGCLVTIYDCNAISIVTPGVHCTPCLAHLIEASAYIFGCTGQNSIKNLDPLLRSKKDKTLISCSSEDKEFLSLLSMIQKERNANIVNVLDEVQYTTSQGGIVRILRGGFPVNFDNSGESVPGDDIQLTRALALSSILQATLFFSKNVFLGKGGIYMLDPSLQCYVASQWLNKQAHSRFSMQTINNFRSTEWIINNSEGQYEPFARLQKYFAEHSLGSF
jgi:S-adenosylhomocysteine hydrolase